MSADNGSPANPGVLLVSHGLQTVYERGFCNGLHDAGLAFTLVSSDQTDYAGLRPGTQTLNLRGSQLANRSRWRKVFNFARYHLSLLWHVARHRPSAVHVMGLIEPPWLCGVIEGLWFHLWAGHYILTVHDTEPHDFATPLSRRLFSWSFRIAGTLVAHTDQVRRQLIAGHGVAEHRVVVMEHGVEPLTDLLPLPPPRSRPQPLRLLVFGKVMRYKGIDLVLDAMARMPGEATLVIAGSCIDPVLTAELSARIASHPQAHAVRWINAHIADEEVAALFYAAEVLVLAYRRIDQSGVLFQGLRHGAPMVVARVGALADYVDASNGEVFEPGDADALHAALLRLRERYADFDRERIRHDARRYEWQRTVQVLRPLYEARTAAPLAAS